MAERWTPDSWRGKPILQVPDYPDKQALADVEKQLATFPPLVFAGEARNLKKPLARVAAGEAFLLQGGDCAESFAEHGANNIRDFFRVFLQMAVVLTYAARLAGGEGRPHRRPVRQAALVADREARRHGAAELSRRHHQRHRLHRRRRAVPIRAGRSRPIASRRRRSTCCAPSPTAATPASSSVHQWMLGIRSRTRRSRKALCRAGRPHLRGARLHAAPAGSTSRVIPSSRTTDFYTSHEALLLGYEQAMTRVDSTTGDWYATSGHMFWIGDRTRQPDHAHVESAAASRIRSASNAARRSRPTSCCG